MTWLDGFIEIRNFPKMDRSMKANGKKVYFKEKAYLEISQDINIKDSLSKIIAKGGDPSLERVLHMKEIGKIIIQKEMEF